jgi:hypothetical protein
VCPLEIAVADPDNADEAEAGLRVEFEKLITPKQSLILNAMILTKRLIMLKSHLFLGKCPSERQRLMIRKYWFIVALTFAGACACRGVIIADWTFETSQPSTAGPIAPEQGSGAASVVGVSSITSPIGDGSAHSFSATHWDSDDYYQFSTSTLNYNNIGITFEATGSSTGPKNFKLQYSTDGSTFSDSAFTYSVLINGTPNTTWSSSMSQAAASVYAFSFNLSSLSILDNQNSIYFRLIDTSATTGGAIDGGDVGTGGTSRVDDFAISGEIAAVPEPAAAGAIAGVGLLALCTLRIWRQRSCGEKLKS